MIGRTPVLLVVSCLLASACGSASGGAGGATLSTVTPHGSLTISPQNTSLLVGVNRIAIAVMRGQSTPVLGAAVSFDVLGGANRSFEHGRLVSIGPDYPAYPLYIGTAKFPQAGDYRLHVIAASSAGQEWGDAIVTVTTTSREPHVGDHAPPGQQRVAADVGGDLTKLDSGVPPDRFHTTTIAAGLLAHQPMLLYFGEPGRCVSRQCVPTIHVVEELARQYGTRLLVEHIEIHDPAAAESYNPPVLTWKLVSEPWVYFVNADGVVADRFEGPVNLPELQQAAEGTLAGRVPAVDIPL